MSAENLSDIAKVFSHNTTSQHVISADVPAALYKLAMSIRAERLTEKFLSAAATDSRKALDAISGGSNSARLLEMFFKMHGHRGPKELYYDAKTWAEDPDLLVHSLKVSYFAQEFIVKENNYRQLCRTTDQIKEWKK